MYKWKRANGRNINLLGGDSDIVDSESQCNGNASGNDREGILTNIPFLLSNPWVSMPPPQGIHFDRCTATVVHKSKGKELRTTMQLESG